MKIYDTSALKALPPSELITQTQAANLSGIQQSTVNRWVKLGEIKTFTVNGCAKPRLMAGDVMQLVSLMNRKAALVVARKAKKVARERIDNNPERHAGGPEMPVMGIFEAAVERAPTWFGTPSPEWNTVGELASWARLMIKTKDSSLRDEALGYLEYLEGIK